MLSNEHNEQMCQILIVTAAALTAAVVILSGTERGYCSTSPTVSSWGFPWITSLQMSVLQPSAKIREEQRLSRQRTMDASRGAVVRDLGIAGQSGM